MKNNLPPVFIVSSGRSGTTLLTAMLNASGQIFIPHESYFLARAYPLYGKTCSFSEDDYQALAELFKIWRSSDIWVFWTISWWVGIISSNQDFNNIIKELKPDKRKVKAQSRGGMPFQFILSTARKKNAFLKRFKETQGEWSKIKSPSPKFQVPSPKN